MTDFSDKISDLNFIHKRLKKKSIGITNFNSYLHSTGYYLSLEVKLPIRVSFLVYLLIKKFCRLKKNCVAFVGTGMLFYIIFSDTVLNFDFKASNFVEALFLEANNF